MLIKRTLVLCTLLICEQREPHRLNLRVQFLTGHEIWELGSLINLKLVLCTLFVWAEMEE
jgi:hypothetical protein